MIRKTILASSILGVGLLIGACGNQTQTQMNSTNTSESSQPKVTESSRKSSESASKNQTTIKKVTDNEYKRILVMEEKATGTTYKSILIKKQNRLKIVNETTDELLYNGTL
ncbi:lipoprotein [Enterococcus faecalis EnGen0089]|uniref:Lipoprotein n=2 Tax=Enterococcus TaxID=1350 RepID=A0A855UI58_ENTFL|nr:lipoprotein [Enterococcus faecalis EnGen0070]EOE41374.1 lipoprotein [Enterococcus faecalis EnGen0106]EOE44650.1 lipoprotein [Enterococcus faecalis EnGen0067]EOE47524.1 lipoprotein [Enterococcus faecalis EnGen0088]EOE48454.1 lipoprotein [Enterococcus faecalis EnGen0089]EOE53371.1 lipoprotein [Enterococcus faecalis EnGen0120]EOE56220.1 lipoprotein [Enterococcus faecalis EnGen0090]EOE59882.1 lipoprotein [Enterococcus faecalis EnGen0109]EOE63211.1 lipoprotein [Enterococcus faecalis EnGen0091